MKKRWILIILTIVFLWIVVSRFTELEQLKTTLTQGQWSWILAAIAVQIVYIFVFASSYQAAFSALDIRMHLRDLVSLTLGSLFVNVIVPAGGAGGTALFANEVARHGKSPTKAAAAVLLQLIADFTAFALILVPGMVYLFIQHDLKAHEIVAAVILVLLTLGLTTILLLGIWKQEWLYRLFRWAQKTANWLFGHLHRSLSLAEDWAQKNAGEFNQAAAAVASHPLALIRTVGVAFLAHLLDVATLYILFLAFNQPVRLGVLVAGYAIGILFWIVSITPSGIGVVEGLMALTFTSLGIPGAAATTITLAFRGLTFWIPMLLGFFAVQRLRTFGSNERTLTETWGVRFAAILVALMGIVNVLSAVTPSLANRIVILEKYSPLTIRHGGHLTAALSGFALLLLAQGLGRRKRVAWVMTLIVLGISAVSHLVKGLDYEEALLAVGIGGMLWLMRHHFHARSDPPSIQQGLQVLAGALLFTLAYGVMGFFLLDRHYSVNFGFWAALKQTVIMFTQFYDPGLVPTTHFGKYFSDSIYLVGATTLGYAGLMLLRPVFTRKPATDEERSQAKEIVEKYGHSSLARMLLFNDKHYYFTQGGSVIGYAQRGRIAVALGDPIGPAQDQLASIQEFKAFCQQNDWLPAFYQTLPETLESYKQAGFDALCIGNEGIVDLETFSLEGKAGKALRNPINKMTSRGYKFVVYQPPIPDSVLEELRAISNEWLTNMHGSEKKFSLGWFDGDYIRSSAIGALLAPEGWISAFVNIIPEYQANEANIDLMRHRKEIENGTMEFLFVSLIQWAKAQGYQGFNLGLSGLSGVGEKPGDPIIEQGMHFIYEHVNQFYNFKGLHAFKEKFRPRWEPRYIIFPGTTSLPSVLITLSQATSNSNLPRNKFEDRTTLPT